MIQLPTIIKDKKGTEFIFRTPRSNEAELILESMAEIAASSPYILSTPESFRSRSVELQIKWIEDSEKSDTSVIIGVYDKSGKIVGFCNGSSYKDIKRKHRASLGVSIHPDYRSLGLGKKLMEVLIDKMKTFSDIKMIELDVMTKNEQAVRIYQDLGFKKVGILPNAFILPNGEKIDNMHMYLDV